MALCLGTGPVHVTPPTPGAAEAAQCRDLAARLPDTLRPAVLLDGREPVQHRTAVTPVSDLTAAWGDPAVVLQCGVLPADDEPSDDQECYDGDGDACTGGVLWFHDALVMAPDPARWRTRTSPHLLMTVPDGNATGTSGPLTAVADALLGRPQR